MYLRIASILENCLMPILILFIRIWMARIFWYSGLVKISDWQTTIMLFKDMYKVPMISPQIAAYLTAGSEIICPILLLLGIATRFASVVLLILTMVIQFTYLNQIEHIYWMILLSTILCYGGGFFSLDNFIYRKWFLKKNLY